MVAHFEPKALKRRIECHRAGLRCLALSEFAQRSLALRGLER
jgi:hypothetical protein